MTEINEINTSQGLEGKALVITVITNNYCN